MGNTARHGTNYGYPFLWHEAMKAVGHLLLNDGGVSW